MYTHPVVLPPHCPVVGLDLLYPVHRIYCVGRNYADHVREMGGTPEQSAPVFFTKPADALVLDPQVGYPIATRDLHHEVELVVALGGWDPTSAETRAASIYGYAVGCDLTRRDLQQQMKAKGQPWDVAKAFDASAPISPIAPASRIGHPRRGRIWLEVDGELRQDGLLEQMILDVDALLVALAGYFELRAGDLIYTGTPAGVGPLMRGQRVVSGIEGVGELSFVIV